MKPLEKYLTVGLVLVAVYLLVTSKDAAGAKSVLAGFTSFNVNAIKALQGI